MIPPLLQKQQCIHVWDDGARTYQKKMTVWVVAEDDGYVRTFDTKAEAFEFIASLEKEKKIMEDKLQMINLYKTYGYEFPLKASYKRQDNRIYFISDFNNNEEIYFFWNCEQPSSCAAGNAFYKNKAGISNLINITELEPLIDEEPKGE